VILKLVSFSARHPVAVLLSTLITIFACLFAERKLVRDAIPDLSDPQVVLIAEWMGRPAERIASEVVKPLEDSLREVADVTAVRGVSMSGMAYVDVVFASKSELSRGRADILERVSKLESRLPEGVRLYVGPEASSTGWVFQYALMPPEKTQTMPMAESGHETSERALRSLRSFQDDVLKPALSAIPGVAEVATLGGHPPGILVKTSADQLRSAGVAFSDLTSSLSAALEKNPHATPAELQVAPLSTGPAATAQARTGRVATVISTPEMASGVADIDGATPAVGGIVIARRDADVRAVTDQIKAVLHRERPHLPDQARLGVVYDRSELTAGIERTLLRALSEEVAVVALIALLFLLHLRSALIPVVTLPLVVLITFAVMRLFGVTATVMSLGGIAIALGLAVDAELVALDACHRRLQNGGGTGENRRANLIAASAAFAPAILTSLMIAAFAFIPVFAFEGETGRLIRPLAITKTVVILAAAVVALTTAPALRQVLLRGRVVAELDNPLTRGLVRLYRPFVNFALSRPAFTLVTALLFALSCLPVATRLGSEFLPRIDEGDLLYMPTTAPGITPEEAALELERQDLDISEQPEVALTFGKIGRAETATDPASWGMAETTIRLKPRDQWPKGYTRRWYSDWAPAPLKRVLSKVWPEEVSRTTAEVVAALDRSTQFPGWVNAWTAPVRARMDMMTTGVRTAVGVRIVTEDLARLDVLGAAVQAAAARVPGTKSANYESLGGERRLTFEPDPAALARYGVEPALAARTADLLLTGGLIGQSRPKAPEGNTTATFTPRNVRVSLEAPWHPKRPEDMLRDATVRARSGQPVALGLLGRPVFVSEPAVLRSEAGAPCAYVHIDVADGEDLGGYVERARASVAGALTGSSGLKAGERLEWTGQYPLLRAGERRLALIAPLVALSMLGLLLLQFRSIPKALIVFASVPFALVGSVWTLYFLDYRLSAPVWVGLLSVVGLAMQTGVLMIVYIDDAFERRVRAGRMQTREDVIEAHAEGTVLRLRPKIMTILTMGACLLPLLWADGAGAEIMRRIAAPMIGGLVTSAFLTLEVLPVLYTIWRVRQLEAARRQPARVRVSEEGSEPQGIPQASHSPSRSRSLVEG
jgi:Cu(I)/Ag(I) efflux system membrane protein CusA/SilA